MFIYNINLLLYFSVITKKMETFVWYLRESVLSNNAPRLFINMFNLIDPFFLFYSQLQLS